ncbi:NAD-dependent epimerase/dehydratase family protein [Agrococcus sp. TSP3-2-1]|uniref:polysaccharide biosynthesis C-terminal domain-containing protein n=1 Tax=Agrococcus sp. TSP3-2-1 TaxID=2804583 RepID=UPI003CF0F3BA
MKVAMTGAGGFLGWHTRAALRESNVDVSPISMGDAFDDAAAVAAASSERFIHIAGVNRGTDPEVQDGNLRFAQQAAFAITTAIEPPRVVVFANSTQSKNGSVYGEAKARAAATLATAAERVGAEFIDLQLPNLYGEHGRPFYNAVTSTFCRLLADGDTPMVEQDKELTLLHAQDAADALTGAIPPSGVEAKAERERVSGLLGRLEQMAATYRGGDMPDVSAAFDRNLFNTYRSYTFPEQAPVRLTRHADARGSFFEIIRTHGGTGQSSFSTTAPGVTRGDHFHRRKIERFTVLSGCAVIRLRRLFTDDVIEFAVDGDAPAAVDMPTMWSHSIENIGDELLYTSFWTNDIFNPVSPDTIAEAVR